MKKSLFFFITVLCATVSSSYTHVKLDPYSYLPNDSLIKEECAQCGQGNWFYANDKQKACKNIRETLAKFNEPDPEPGLLGLLFGLLIGPNGRDLMGDLHRQANTSEMKENVFAVLGEKCTKEQMRDEHEKLWQAALAIRADRGKNSNKASQGYSTYKKPEDPY